MFCEDVLVALCCLLFVIARSKETLDVWQGVRGPLLCGKGEECAAKVNCVLVLMGGHRHFFSRWKSHICKDPTETRVFDATRGFPGEDIRSLPLQ